MTVTTDPAVELYRLLSQGRLDELVGLLSPDFRGHGMGGEGPESVRKSFASWLRSFPDTSVEVRDVLHDGDKAVVRTTMRGTHQGRFMGVEPTGKTFKIGSTDIHRVVDGRIVESWALCDLATLLIQIGAFRAS